MNDDWVETDKVGSCGTKFAAEVYIFMAVCRHYFSFNKFPGIVVLLDGCERYSQKFSKCNSKSREKRCPRDFEHMEYCMTT